MRKYSFTEENYLKILYLLSSGKNATVQTNLISEKMQTKPASVTDMLKKLANKQMIDYVKYQGATLTDKGKSAAIKVIRKHRLWEVFLVNKLNFKWDEVHDIAEQLEHINSDILVERLDEYLAFPKKDPHGDAIPDRDGHFEELTLVKLNKLKPGNNGIIIGVSEHSTPFLRYLDKVGLTLGVKLQVSDVIDFDGSVELLKASNKIIISKEVASHVLIKLLE